MVIHLSMVILGFERYGSCEWLFMKLYKSLSIP